jgi:hypothetical protein
VAGSISLGSTSNIQWKVCAFGVRGLLRRSSECDGQMLGIAFQNSLHFTTAITPSAR